ncbi:hypothetical protein Vadar_029863 [Vaccinium darrowii]|uniref:Uncharacterized protein n=1 Tax=Vaccinium darrowii TaxID=229202 RepID=A0ACB7ZFR6_9ERIC|nr:hypothetical protein Vadar_029863 [Vaccinium darrowii]
MGKNKNKNTNKINQGEQQNEHENQNDDGNSNTTDGGENKDGGVPTVVLKVDLHCEGCETKIKKCIRSFKGVEWVKGSDDGSNKLTVIGNVDPVNLREMLEKKTKKKVELVSPQPKKDKGKDKDGGDNKQEKKPEKEKLKEIPVTTAVMKLNLHCQGCIQKLRKAVAKTKGFHDMSVDEEKNLITVKGAIDMKALAESLKVKLKKPVEIVPPKKEKEKDKDKNGGGSENKEKGGGGGGGWEKGDQNMDIQYARYGYPNPECVNGYGWVYPEAQFHAPQMFSDENPNACSIM